MQLKVSSGATKQVAVPPSLPVGEASQPAGPQAQQVSLPVG